MPPPLHAIFMFKHSNLFRDMGCIERLNKKLRGYEAKLVLPFFFFCVSTFYSIIEYMWVWGKGSSRGDIIFSIFCGCRNGDRVAVSIIRAF